MSAPRRWSFPTGPRATRCRHSSRRRPAGSITSQDFEIINISGLEDQRRYPKPQDVKNAIARAAANSRKTLTLTVNRMLTGSTVEQWDTMLFLKDTASPQEYDQATFRIQSQHIRSARERDDGRRDPGEPEAADALGRLRPESPVPDAGATLADLERQHGSAGATRTSASASRKTCASRQSSPWNSDRLREVEPTRHPGSRKPVQPQPQHRRRSAGCSGGYGTAQDRGDPAGHRASKPRSAPSRGCRLMHSKAKKTISTSIAPSHRARPTPVGDPVSPRLERGG